ncbi:ABC transporter permease [bacterium]|nr:ABC transporter permease [bacterium]
MSQAPNTWLEPYRELVASRELLYELTTRDLRIRYKQTALGTAWALFTPLVMMFIFTQIFARVAKVDTSPIPYSIFVYCGLLPWQFFSTSLKSSVDSLTRNRLLVTKIYMPREVFPISQVLSAFADFLVASIVLAGLMLWHGIAPASTMWFVPVILLVQTSLTIGLALLLSMGNLFYRDVKYLFEVGLLLWMFATSVIYPIQLAGPWAWVLHLNPMTPIIDAYRSVLLLGQYPDPVGFGYAAVVAIALLVLGMRWFHESEYQFAESI